MFTHLIGTYIGILSHFFLNRLLHGFHIGWANTTVHFNIQPVQDKHQLGNYAINAWQLICDRVQLCESHISNPFEAKEVDNLQ